MTEKRTAPLFFSVANVAFVLAMVGVAALAAWPLYQSWPFVALVAVSAAVATAIAVTGTRRSWTWLRVALVAIAAYLVLGVPLAIPFALTGFVDALAGLVDLLTASVFGWKQLVTISMPSGSYQAVLVPALMVFLFGTVVAVSFALRLKRLWFLAAAIALAMQVFGLAFGSSGTSALADVGIIGIAAPREVVVSLLDFLLALAFLLWRVSYARRQAVASARVTSGLRQGRESVGSHARRVILAIAILLVAVFVSASLSPALAGVGERRVLRSAVDPETAELVRASPLTRYREYFKNDYDTDLFSVTSTSTSPVRVRLATLSYYDGQYFTAVDPSTGDGTDVSQFARVPYRLQPDSDGTDATVTVTIDEYSGVWLPTAGELVEARFGGRDAAVLSDGFYYNAGVAAGIEAAPISKGDTYSLDVRVPAASVDLASITAPTQPSMTVVPSLIPERLVEWANSQSEPSSLSALVTHLTDRGFLSHAIDVPAPGSWVDDLGDYTFAASQAGHSVDRIDSLFDQLLTQQKQASPDADDKLLVAGIGDDEQFSVAVALLAQHLGFASRVVLGFTTGGATLADNRIPSCVETCKGQNLTAWAEVQDGATGQWVTVDATPQHVNPLAKNITEQKLPSRPTVVVPQAATPQDPPAANPSGSNATSQTPPDAGDDLGWLAGVLTTVGLSLLGLLVLLAPLATILFAKARRRSERRRATDPEARIVGGWDEYLDAALDHGYPKPTSETRTQIAGTYRTPHGIALAVMTDRAVFGPVDPGSDEGERFWQILEGERLAFARGMSRWQRWRAAFSVRSITQHVRGRQRPAKR